MDKIIADLEQLSVKVAVSVEDELACINASVEQGLKDLELFFSEYRQN